MSDEHDEWAAKALPCTARCTVAAYPYSGVVSHSMDCPYHYRTGIAAALRVAESNKRLYLAASADAAKHKAEVERLKKCLICEGGACGHAIEAAELRAKLAEAEAHRAELERYQAALGQANADLMGCRDGALLRDLRAKLAETEAELETRNEEVDELSKQVDGLQAAHAECSFTGARLMSAEGMILLRERELDDLRAKLEEAERKRDAAESKALMENLIDKKV